MYKILGFTLAVLGFGMMFIRGAAQLAGASLAMIGVSMAWYGERNRV